MMLCLEAARERERGGGDCSVVDTKVADEMQSPQRGRGSGR